MKKLVGIICLAYTLIASGASAEIIRVANDRGGQIGQYLRVLAMVREDGDSVMIDGDCLSACTLVLGVLPRDRVCATEKARFGFHAAWMPDSEGNPVTSALGTQALWKIYKPAVRSWILRHGGLKRKMIYLEGRDVFRIVRRCAETAATGPSPQISPGYAHINARAYH